MTNVPTVEDFEKAQAQIEQLNSQIRERNDEIKSLKGSGKNDSGEISTIVKEVVSAELKSVLDPLKKQNEELKIALAGKPGVAISSGGSEAVAEPPKKWSDAQLEYFKSKGIDPDKVQNNIK